MYKVAVVVGSTHPTSSNMKLARALEKLAEGRLSFEFVDISDLPFYDDTLWDNPPQPVVRLKHQIIAADAVLFVTPEYNRSIPGILKNALDWPSRPYGKSVWSGKPAAIAGATGGVSGTAAAQSHLRSILPMMGMALMGTPEIYFQSRPGAIDDDLTITDERVRNNLHAWVDKFVGWIGLVGETEATRAAAE